MTSERDFDSLARAWLELGPNEAPDRVVAAVLQAAETTPQVRRPIRWLPLRDDKMTRLPVLATVAATIVVVIGGLFLINRPNPGVGGPTASTSPSVAPSSASPSAAPLSLTLKSTRWMGSERPVPGILPKAGTIINFTVDNQFYITQSNLNQYHFLNSVASSSGDGQFQLETTGGGDACSTGDIGLYRWSVTPSGRILTIVATSDDCPTRLSAVPGTWWLEACKNADTNCLGNLDAGTYKSQYITPRLDAGMGLAWEPDFGALTYTVPDGWANSVDFPEWFSLTPSADFALEGEAGPPEDVVHRIELHWQYAASAQNSQCTSEEVTSVPRTVAGLVDWIRALPSLDAGAPTTITIDGHPGQWLDIGVAPSWKTHCPGATPPIAVLFTEAGGAGDPFAIGALDKVRLVFLDLGGGDILMVDVLSSDAARFDDLAAQAMPIIQSFHFE
jgi:hypothetical protein